VERKVVVSINRDERAILHRLSLSGRQLGVRHVERSVIISSVDEIASIRIEILSKVAHVVWPIDGERDSAWPA
jgi:hypothetical protein